MRQWEYWSTCVRCRHVVNPRSEICSYSHSPCSADGCLPQWQRLGDVLDSSLDPEPAHLSSVGGSATTFLVDVASYQAGIDLAAIKAAGFGAINVKLTQGNWYTHAAAPAYVRDAQALGLGVCTFHWLDNSASGATQAAYAYKAMQAAGGPHGMAHQVDCEDPSHPATLTIWRDYVSWWQAKLGRPVTNYTGDWWWQPRGWPGAGLVPYLWAAPNSGYLAAYPGNDSPAWSAGYGGWDSYALLQYAVGPVAGAGGGSLSKTAIRDPAVWAALTGTPQPAPTTTKGDHMLLLTHLPDGRPAVCDGMSCRAVTDRDVTDLQWLGKNGALQLGNGGQFWEGYAPAMGVLVDESAQPVVTLTDAQAAQIAAAIVARPDNPLGSADEPAITAAVKQALREGIGPASASAAAD